MLAFTVFTVLTVWSVGAYVMYAKVDEKTSLKPRNIFLNNYSQVPSARRSRKQNGVDSATMRLTSNSGNNDNYSTTTTQNDDDDDTY